MNEKSLLKTWKTFAAENKLEFTTEDRPNVQGVITEYVLNIETGLVLKARIGKTSSYAQHTWSKLVLENIEHKMKE